MANTKEELQQENTALTQELDSVKAEVQRRDLKITALTQRLSEIVAEYENKVADLRVLLTVQSASGDASADAA